MKPYDVHGVRDRLVQDSCAAEAESGALPNPRAAADLWASILKQLDRDEEDLSGKSAKEPSVPDNEEDRAEWRAERKTHKKDTAEKLAAKTGGTLVYDSEIPKQNPLRKPRTKRERVEALLAKRRMVLLGSIYEWKKKVLDAYNEGARIAFRTPGARLEIEQGKKILEVLDESSNPVFGFGDWRAIPKGPALYSLPPVLEMARMVKAPLASPDPILPATSTKEVA